MTTPPRLHDPVIQDGLRTINFFNGRLLTAEDLRTEQEFAAAGRRRLGLAIGAGVVTGLRVSLAAANTATRPVVTVEAGHAINRVGDVVALPVTVDVDLAMADPSSAATGTGFGPCSGTVPAGTLPGSGVYLLVAHPAGERRGRAPASGLDTNATCAADAIVEGAAFDLVPLGIPVPEAEHDRALLRNRVAHLILGSADGRRYLDFDPLHPQPQHWGLLDDLRAVRRLDDACVPLAVLSWSVGTGIAFVDNWAVRRRTVAPPAGSPWPGDRVRAEAEAAYQQFQDHVSELAVAGRDLDTARTWFEYLPPVGMVPVLARAGDAGFDRDAFLGTQGSRGIETLNADDLPALLADGLPNRPLWIANPAARFRRYWVYENLVAVVAGANVPLAMVFAAECVPPRSTSRFAFAHFGTSTVAATAGTPRQED